MSIKKQFFTSESVSEGHPDKLCDQIADAILDACLEQDEHSHVACEVLATENKLVLSGEITTNANLNYEQIARDVIRDIGYTKDDYGFNADNVEILNFIHEQSPDIKMGIEYENGELGAGDQGIMFGFATDESENYMPLPLVISHKLVRKATELRKNGLLANARPDMKSQVTLDMTDKSNIKVKSLILSVQHNPDIDMEVLKSDLLNLVVKPVLESFNIFTMPEELLINKTGNFVIGGPKGDTGVTGRKIIVDTYGGSAPHGGGAFSGKDPTKVDRSASYYARYVCKNIVAAGLASKMTLQVSYCIGNSKPISIWIDTHNTNNIPNNKILDIIDKVFDFSPKNIIESLNLRKPTFKYHHLTNYGHFGRPDLDLPFEKLDKVDQIKKLSLEY